MGWAKHVARMEMRNAYIILDRNPKGKRSLGSQEHWWEEHTKLGLKERGCEDMTWIKLPQDRFKWGSLWRSDFSISWAPTCYTREALHHGIQCVTFRTRMYMSAVFWVHTVILCIYYFPVRSRRNNYQRLPEYSMQIEKFGIIFSKFSVLVCTMKFSVSINENYEGQGWPILPITCLAFSSLEDSGGHVKGRSSVQRAINMAEGFTFRINSETKQAGSESWKENHFNATAIIIHSKLKIWTHVFQNVTLFSCVDKFCIAINIFKLA
jgi:hypothetical protein